MEFFGFVNWCIKAACCLFLAHLAKEVILVGYHGVVDSRKAARKQGVKS